MRIGAPQHHARSTAPCHRSPVASPMYLSEQIAGANDGDANVILGMQIGTVTDNACR
jgi:hypothetical protein